LPVSKSPSLATTPGDDAEATFSILSRRTWPVVLVTGPVYVVPENQVQLSGDHSTLILALLLPAFTTLTITYGGAFGGLIPVSAIKTSTESEAPVDVLLSKTFTDFIFLTPYFSNTKNNIPYFAVGWDNNFLFAVHHVATAVTVATRASLQGEGIRGLATERASSAVLDASSPL